MFQIIREVGFKKFIVAGVKEMYRKIFLEIILNTYSQDKEDLIIDKLLNTKKGFYLEIGGYHPTRLSNTYRLYKKGWKGVVIEPNPDIKKKFKKIRPRDRFLNFGVGEKDGQLTYYKYLIPALNTFSQKQVKENSSFKVINTERIKVLGIRNLLAKYLPINIDFLSLDVEGWDKEILHNWDWKFKPKVICVEDRSIKLKGYKLFARTKYNSIFFLEN